MRIGMRDRCVGERGGGSIVNSEAVGGRARGRGASLVGGYDFDTYRDAVMMGEILLRLLQGFQGKYENAVSHMNEEIRYMLNWSMRLLERESVLRR